ncbi:hypothetical protein BDP27DRAFT_1418416 [Rhodocollybia butyracea]|uniref:DUF6534 domain-containing protein n=1 Tax=Rhodocollybia butyracea TaxID=206335 RepID=A0A9P5PZ51_9AGAR|nr:hypothetical protein BDP27DRAFT_1418416 [Rhodocollybia butyracea]
MSTGSSAGGIPPGINISELSGPAIIGYLLHWGLFGTLSVQTYLYYLAFPNDRYIIKCVVYGIFTIEVIQTVLITHDAFAIFGYGFGNFDSLTDIHMEWFTVPVMSGVVAFVGQAFYAYRIWVLSRSKVVPLLILLVSLVSSVAAFMTGVYDFQIGNVIAVTQSSKTSIAGGIWCGAAALGDITIAVCMTYYLSHMESGFKSTHSLITKYTRLTIETGSVTALVALLDIILFFGFPTKGYYITPVVIMPKLYANSILVVLNARMRILGGRRVYMSTFDNGGLGGSGGRLRTTESVWTAQSHCKTCQCNHDLESGIRLNVFAPTTQIQTSDTEVMTPTDIKMTLGSEGGLGTDCSERDLRV